MSTVFEGKNVSATIFRLGVPAMLSQLATLIYNMADTYFVSMTKCGADCGRYALCSCSSHHHVHSMCIWYGRRQCDCKTVGKRGQR